MKRKSHPSQSHPSKVNVDFSHAQRRFSPALPRTYTQLVAILRAAEDAIRHDQATTDGCRLGPDRLGEMTGARTAAVTETRREKTRQ